MLGKHGDRDDSWDRPPEGNDAGELISVEGEWTIPSTDEDGHSAREYVVVPPRIARKLEEVVQAGTLPYRTKADLIRHAIYRHTHWLRRTGHTCAEVDEITLAIEGMVKVLHDQQQAAKTRLICEQYRDTLIEQMNGDDIMEAKRTYMRLRQIVERTKERPWRRTMIAYLNETYQRLMAGDRTPVSVRTHLSPQLVIHSRASKRVQSEENEDTSQIAV